MKKLTYLFYKEPLRPIEDGFGYYGTLAQTEDGDEVQCHICGGTYYNLGSHVFNFHQLKGREYRKKFGLSLKTPLCSDRASQEYKQRALERWNAMSETQQQAKRDFMATIAKDAPKRERALTSEEMNKKGICPDQLLEKLKTCGDKLGKTPTVVELSKFYGTQRYYHPLVRTFGSYKKACEYAGLIPNKPGSKGGAMPTYSKEMLLQYLKDHHQKTGLPPTSNDCNRGFIPTLATYIKHFGGIREARKEAGLPEYVSTRWKDFYNQIQVGDKSVNS